LPAILSRPALGLLLLALCGLRRDELFERLLQLLCAAPLRTDANFRRTYPKRRVQIHL